MEILNCLESFRTIFKKKEKNCFSTEDLLYYCCIIYI